TYNQAEQGVVVQAAATDGDALTAGVSRALAVLAPAVKLAVINIAPATPMMGRRFSVGIQAEDSAGAAANVAERTIVRLSLKTGTGALGGTLTAVIAAGEHLATITGVTYDHAENGVSLQAAASEGDALTAGTSRVFAVKP